MAKLFCQSSTLLKEVKPSDDLEKKENDEQKEPTNDEIEKNMILKEINNILCYLALRNLN